MKRSFLFTSESVGEGHPDKLCDQISDSILDAHLKQDQNSRVAVETIANGNKIFLCGEITSKAKINYEEVVKSVLKRIGYDANDFIIQNELKSQSMDISQAVDGDNAGDQGIMFGYATNENEERMPLTLILAHKIVKRLAEIRRMNIKDEMKIKFEEVVNKKIENENESNNESINSDLINSDSDDLICSQWLKPDCKSQVTIEYEEINGELFPKNIHTIILSTQHSEESNLDMLKTFLIEKVIKKVIPENLITKNTRFIVQPSGRFVLGGPMADAGLTGRKIIVDSYGGFGNHGGGCFSGKDWTKVDRSGSYMARWIAKSLVDSNLCKRVLIQISYSIGMADPISVYVDSYGTGNDEELIKIVKNNFDMKPGMICKELELRLPVYERTAVFGHFGRNEFKWEQSKIINSNKE